MLKTSQTVVLTSLGTYRVPLIEDGVAFQVDYFRTRIRQGKIRLNDSRQWYRALTAKVNAASQDCQSAQNVIAMGMVEFCLDIRQSLPTTLEHDACRLESIHLDVQDLIYLQICCDVFSRFAQHHLGPDMHPDRTLPETLFRRRIVDLAVSDDTFIDPPIFRWHSQLDLLALEIVRQTYRFAGDNDTPPIARHVDMVYAWLSKAVDSIDNNSLDDDKMQDVGAGQVAPTASQEIARQLLESTLEHTTTFETMSPLEIAESQRRHQLSRNKQGVGDQGSSRQLPDIDDLGRKVAHMAVLHWRVWCELAYSEPAADEEAAETGDGEQERLGLADCEMDL
jgi:hypothetical protein